MKKILMALMLLLLSVSPVYAGEATLTWDAPTTNADGTPLTDLGGYKVYYGVAPRIYGTPTDVGKVLTYKVINLSEGTKYFAVTAYDTSGNESCYSNEVSKTIVVSPACDKFNLKIQ